MRLVEKLEEGRKSIRIREGKGITEKRNRESSV